ncbi:MAG: hypothetical protein COV34_01625 [Candidatus Zambryskibacteria bacterium CG10_big_fil_rev_8_21_14_0_10_42_12]|uniref:Phenylalanine--tRNA ligase beta subunit n=1 Tax=Candidatus Zambryskibacteria bacterium CG10_big_fil_rev_8_21_14_0_10_42_12 TaxID=1975115 RepID=A0A2H0QVI0_9BACT|nr:MAG: hypothetical protein COV34_01625 [Candidatus Zambryskibacteria bacterium CG10_big_fil_rev_8_21_14_0_10_42_12]
MKVSYKWLQSYFKESLPSPHELADILNTRAFEIESVDEIPGGDAVIDVDILPNRSHDCLAHRGIAREIGVLLSRTTEEPVFDLTQSVDALGFTVDVEDPIFCTRFVGVRMHSVSVTDSPKWIEERLATIGQRSINNIVDITNFVMFDLGKPMHAFDADKVVGNLVVRIAKEGENITTLDGKDVALNASMHVIADDISPLAIAGVKGGIRAEVTKETKNILIESAVFDGSTIRKTSRTVGIKTDSSRRFENGIANQLAMDGFMETVALIAEHARGDGFTIGATVDVYPKPDEEHVVNMRVSKLQSLLGVDLTQKEIESIFDRFGFVYEKKDGSYDVTIPELRLDLRIEEDVIEEIGRVYGYEHIQAQPIADMDFKPQSTKEYKVIENIKNILAQAGFSEVQTYMFGDKGEVEVLYPAASDKTKVRADLKTRFEETLQSNARYADLLGISDVRVFEIGKVVKKDGEHSLLALGVQNVKKDKKKESEKITEVLQMLSEKLGYTLDTEVAHHIVEIDLQEVIEKSADISERELRDIISHADDTVETKPVSSYPFVLRDIAVWTPDGTQESDVYDIIKEQGGELLVRIALFDEFKKDGKTSYAFNLVFQSHERTLTDEEINQIMEKISTVFIKQGWTVR